MYATLSCQVRKSSFSKCWRIASRLWNCIECATLWIEGCWCLVKDSTEESRQRSAACFSFLTIFIFVFLLFASSVLCYLCFNLHIFMPSVAKAWLVLPSFCHYLLVLSLPFLFLLHTVSLTTSHWCPPLEFVRT